MTYDGIYRLTNETIGNDPTNKNGSVSYGLDPVGNRQSASSSLSGVNSGSFTYNVDDETSTDTYDANGNTTTSGGKTFTFDSENHMTSMTGNGKVVTMVYDAFGNRVSKTVNGVTTQYLIEDDVNPTGLPQVVEETVNGAVTRSYTYGLERISEAQVINNVWTPSFYEYDGAGSVRQLTNLAANVTVTDTYEYDAFGNAVNKTGATPNNYLYRGEQFDPDLGLYYLRARYYNPATGRFLSVDPLSDEGQRRYEYAAANSVDGMDPNGSEALIEYALVPHIFPPVWIPNWCGLSGTNPMGGSLPCIHRQPKNHEVTVSYWPKPAMGFGHVGVGLDSDDTSGFYPIKKALCLATGCSTPGNVFSDQMKEGVAYATTRIATTAGQNAMMKMTITQREQNAGMYNLFNRNCAEFVEDVLDYGGVPYGPYTERPTKLFTDLGGLIAE
jgi:RHS repeat-associated protein